MAGNATSPYHPDLVKDHVQLYKEAEILFDKFLFDKADLKNLHKTGV